MCISLTPNLGLLNSTVITNTVDDVHHITYMIELGHCNDKIGGFLIFPGAEAKLITAPSIETIQNYHLDVFMNFMPTSKSQLLASSSNINIINSTTVFSSLQSLISNLFYSLDYEEQLLTLVNKLTNINELKSQNIILCLFPLNVSGLTAFTYSIKGDLHIPGWENDHSRVNDIHPYIERKSTYIIGKNDPKQKSKAKQMVSNSHKYCFPTDVANYSNGVSESKNGNLTLHTNQFGYNELISV